MHGRHSKWKGNKTNDKVRFQNVLLVEDCFFPLFLIVLCFFVYQLSVFLFCLFWLFLLQHSLSLSLSRSFNSSFSLFVLQIFLFSPKNFSILFLRWELVWCVLCSFFLAGKNIFSFIFILFVCYFWSFSNFFFF